MGLFATLRTGNPSRIPDDSGHQSFLLRGMAHWYRASWDALVYEAGSLVRVYDRMPEPARCAVMGRKTVRLFYAGCVDGWMARTIKSYKSLYKSGIEYCKLKINSIYILFPAE
jgi:hypothetical protein